MIMSEEKMELLNKYSKLFSLYHNPPERSRWPICWGLECGKGWLPLLDKLCGQIQHHVDWKQKSDPEFEQPIVHQCKEKFGTLRFYIQGGDDHVQGLIALAESMSSIICEDCGVPGKARNDGWIRVLCDPCEKSRQARRRGTDQKSGDENEQP